MEITTKMTFNSVLKRLEVFFTSHTDKILFFSESNKSQWPFLYCYWVEKCIDTHLDIVAIISNYLLSIHHLVDKLFN